MNSESLGAPLNRNVVEAVGLEGVYELDLSINSVDEGLKSVRRHWMDVTTHNRQSSPQSSKPRIQVQTGQQIDALTHSYHLTQYG